MINNIMSPFPICIVCLSICMGLLSAEDQVTVSGHVNSIVILPCKLRVISEKPYIRWSSDKDVFERSGKEFFQGQGYEGRVEISEEKLRDGDCSLVLKNLTLADTGIYKSYQVVKRMKRSSIVRDKWEPINSVELLVDGRLTDTRSAKLLEPAFTNAAGMNWPHSLLMFLSLVSCFHFQLVYKET